MTLLSTAIDGALLVERERVSIQTERTYQIGGGITNKGINTWTHYPISRLTMPVEWQTEGIKIMKSYHPEWHILLNHKRGYSHNQSTFIDEDWLSPQQAPDIIGTGEIRGQYQDHHIQLRYESAPERSGPHHHWAGIGYHWRREWYGIGHMFQRQVATHHTQFRPGDAIHYRVRTEGIVWEIGGRRQWGPMGISLSVGGTPRLGLSDVDNHIDRRKLAIGNGEGFEKIWRVSGSYQLSKHWLAAISFQKRMGISQGVQTQRRQVSTREGPAGPLGTITQDHQWEETGIAWQVRYQERALSYKEERRAQKSPKLGLKVGVGVEMESEMFETSTYPIIGIEWPHLLLHYAYTNSQTKAGILSQNIYNAQAITAYYPIHISPKNRLLMGVGKTVYDLTLWPKTQALLESQGKLGYRESIQADPGIHIAYQWMGVEDVTMILDIKYQSMRVISQSKTGAITRRKTSLYVRYGWCIGVS